MGDDIPLPLHDSIAHHAQDAVGPKSPIARSQVYRATEAINVRFNIICVIDLDHPDGSLFRTYLLRNEVHLRRQ